MHQGDRQPVQFFEAPKLHRLSVPLVHLERSKVFFADYFPK